MTYEVDRRDWIRLGTGAALAASVVTRATASPLPQPVRLSLNENAFGPSPNVAKAIQAALPTLERYVDDADVDALTRQIGQLEDVPAEQIILGEILEPLGLHLAARHPGGGEVVYSTPGYTALVDAAAPLGVIGRGVPLNARLENDLAALQQAIGPRTIALSVVNPHNPSATLSDPRAFDDLVLDAARRTLVIVDEAYLEYDPKFETLSAVRHVRAGANVMVFRTLAKAYGLAGLAMGYGIAPAPLAAELRKAGFGEAHTLNRLSLVAASAALRDQAYVASVRTRTLQQRDRLTAALDRFRLRHTDSHANFVFFETPGRGNATRQAFANAGVTVARSFPPLDDWVRITVGTPEETSRAIAILAAIQ